MAVPLPQEPMPSRNNAVEQAATNSGGPSTGPLQLASSLAKLQQLEDRELKGPSPNMRQSLQQSHPSSNTIGNRSTSGVHESPAPSAFHSSQTAEHGPTRNIEQTLPRALRKHVADLSVGGNSSSTGQLNSSTPFGDNKGEDEERMSLESRPSTLAAGLPKLGPQLSASAQAVEGAGIQKLSQPPKDP